MTPSTASPAREHHQETPPRKKFAMQHSLFFTIWPWIGLGAAIVLLIIAFATNIFRVDLTRSRWHDPAWLAWLGAIAYMLHNVEEYGIDMLGRTMSFPTLMTQVLGVNISEATYLACNLVLVWMVGPIVACVARTLPAIAPGMALFALINGLSHIGQAINLRAYNPGLLTSIVIFLPLAAWTVYACYIKGSQRWSTFGWLTLGAVIYHIILISVIVIAVGDLAAPAIQALIMIVDGALLLGIWYWAAKRAQVQGERVPGASSSAMALTPLSTP